MGLTEFFLAVRDHYEQFSDSEEPRQPAREYLWASLLAMVVYIVIIAFVGKFLWNNYLVKYVTVVSPVKSPVDIIAISVLLGLLFNRV